MRRFLISATLAACVGACFAPPAWAVIPFTDEGANLLTSVRAQDVEPVVGGFRMYVTSGSFEVLSATSTDQASWGLESGVRLSTSPDSLDTSSITSCGVVPSTQTGQGYRMFYVGISSTGLYSILSASSANGLSWTKESGARLQRSGGRRILDSPRPVQATSSLLRLFYVADSVGAGLPSDFRVYSATSTDGGLTFGDEGPVLSAIAYQVDVTTLTDGRTRLYYSAPLTGQTTASQILSAIATDGETFSLESGTRLSTDAAVAGLSYPVLVRSTESFRWRMFYNNTPAASTATFVRGSLTLTPVPTSLNPSSVFRTDPSASFTLSGEVFSPTPEVSFALGSNTILATGETRLSDVAITGDFVPLSQPTGNWNVVVTNADGRTGTLSSGLLIDFLGAELVIVDNLFRPLRGGKATISATTYNPGDVRLAVYTSQGGHVSTLFDGPLPQGTHAFTWNGTTSQGNTVASGLYLLKATGPKLDLIEKIVVIK